jgi:hypothetical protein
MRSLFLDELRHDEITKINDYLKETLKSSNIEGLYWLLLHNDHLTSNQRILQERFGPYKISVEVGANFVKFELLVRGDDLRNEGGGYATEKQIEFIYSFADTMVKVLNLVTC